MGIGRRPAPTRSGHAVDNAGASGSSATATITVSGATNGLVGAFGLDEGTGTTVTDNSGNGRTGTISGVSWVAGRFGQALSLNGTSSVVTFPMSTCRGRSP